MDINNSLALLIDLGNSRIKYAWVQTDGSLAVQGCNNIDELLLVIENASQVVLASVRHPQDSQLIQNLCEQQGRLFTLVETEPQRFSVQCAYKHYQNLGVDRWLAVLAARALTNLPVAVIDVGTAATCDLIVDNQHLGGWITPGFSMMRDSVVSGATRVFSDTSRPQSLHLGKDTPECVNLGCMALIHGLVLQAQQLLERYGTDYRIFLCGGDSDLLFDLRSDQIKVEKDLVFIGLKRFVKDLN